MSGQGGLSWQGFYLPGSHRVRRVRTLGPPLEVYAEREEPQAESSFSQGRGQLDPGGQVSGQARRQEGREAVEEVGEAVDGQQSGDGSRQESGPVHKVGQQRMSSPKNTV